MSKQEEVECRTLCSAIVKTLSHSSIGSVLFFCTGKYYDSILDVIPANNLEIKMNR